MLPRLMAGLAIEGRAFCVALLCLLLVVVSASCNDDDGFSANIERGDMPDPSSRIEELLSLAEEKGYPRTIASLRREYCTSEKSKRRGRSILSACSQISDSANVGIRGVIGRSISGAGAGFVVSESDADGIESFVSANPKVLRRLGGVLAGKPACYDANFEGIVSSSDVSAAVPAGTNYQDVVHGGFRLLLAKAIKSSYDGNNRVAVRMLAKAIGLAGTLGGEPLAGPQKGKLLMVRKAAAAVGPLTRGFGGMTGAGEAGGISMVLNSLDGLSVEGSTHQAARGDFGIISEMFSRGPGHIAMVMESSEEVLGIDDPSVMAANHAKVLESSMKALMAVEDLEFNDMAALESVSDALGRLDVSRYMVARTLAPTYPALAESELCAIARVRLAIIAIRSKKRGIDGGEDGKKRVVERIASGEAGRVGDPWSDGAMRVREKDDHVIVYSIGPDRDDDGGKAQMMAVPGSVGDGDIVVKLWKASG